MCRQWRFQHSGSTRALDYALYCRTRACMLCMFVLPPTSLNTLRAGVRYIRISISAEKNSSFWLPYQRPSSSDDCPRELLNASKESASLVDYTRNKIFWLRVRIFCDWRHNWSSFRVILAHVARPGAQLLGQSVSLKFSLESRLESESFEPLIDFLAFLVKKLWSKINKLINYLIR